ncbi:MAG: metalloregulator ArsR/SmtB family transcription factor [Candidatus Dormibacteraeota bacterium]|nr:metalloregulator ArsR/SmtB family transcription factor [Candidatus Dormibacteraeota bacterium]
MFLPGQQGDLPAFFTALANITRLRIVEQLLNVGEESVNALAIALRMSQPRVSWHLRMLELGGVVITRREGRLTYCSVDLDAIRRRLTGFETLLEARPAGRRAHIGSEVTG